MRVDVPTLRCDRCLTTTQDLSKMGSYRQIVHFSMGGKDLRWDLCHECWTWFIAAVDGGAE